ncbi:MAG: hypothetical protein IRZ04_21660 [Rhodospirillales bacterium]|nr:hypothetical protein [Rhodospirillales bacterium]
MNVPLFGQELAQFINARSLQRFDETDTGARLDDADPALLSEVATRSAGRVTSGSGSPSTGSSCPTGLRV